VRLAEIASLETGTERLRVFTKLNDFCQTGRYPESLAPLPTAEEARRHMTDAGEVLQWLMQQL
jgi:hypothetical protein